MHRISLIVVLVASLMVAACGSSKKKEADQKTPLSKDIVAVCTGKPLSAKPQLPPSFPQIEQDKLTYTRQSKEGPTSIVEGYFHGDVKDAHEEFEKELKAAQYAIVFNELEDHDSEISWKGEGRTGQVAMREECGDSAKTYVHITNRPG